jgi:subtilisin family serine protease
MKYINTITAILITIILMGSNNTNLEFNEQYFNIQWYLDNSSGLDIGALDMWKEFDESSIKNEVIVAVIDTGVDYSHDDLKNKMWVNKYEIPGDGIDNDDNGYIDDIYGWNFCDKSGELISDKNLSKNDHGTMCAGIIAADHNHIGIIGVAGNANIKIMSLKVLEGKKREGKVANVVKAIKYAEKMGASIYNLSFNTYVDNKSLENAIQESNMLFVVSAGNNEKYNGINIDQLHSYPASYNFSNLITVANIDSNQNLFISSNYGNNTVDIAAPGTKIYSTITKNKYGYDTGTSMAAPVVSGVAAVLFAYYNGIDAYNVKNIILNKATKDDKLANRIAEGRILYVGDIFPYDIDNFIKIKNKHLL